MEIIQGEAYNVELTLTDKNGNTIVPEVVSNIIAAIGKLVNRYSNNEIHYDTESGTWYFDIDQKETLGLTGVCPFEVKVKFSTGDVKAKKLGDVNVIKTIIKEEL